MASVPTIFALISKSLEKKLIAERTQDDLIELALDKFMAIHFVDLSTTNFDGTLTTEATCIEWTFPNVLLDY
jgi:hypothetical protein